MYWNALGWNTSYSHPFDLQLQQNSRATEKDTDSKIKVRCAIFFPHQYKDTVYTVKIGLDCLFNKFAWYFYAERN